jgi:hypothetical protein
VKDKQRIEAIDREIAVLEQQIAQLRHERQSLRKRDLEATRQEIVRLREAGETYAAIAAQIGLSEGHVNQIYHHHLFLKAHPRLATNLYSLGLSGRVLTPIHRQLGLNATIADVLKLMAECPERLLTYRGFGPARAAELAKCLRECGYNVPEKWGY